MVVGSDRGMGRGVYVCGRKAISRVCTMVMVSTRQGNQRMTAGVHVVCECPPSRTKLCTDANTTAMQHHVRQLHLASSECSTCPAPTSCNHTSPGLPLHPIPHSPALTAPPTCDLGPTAGRRSLVAAQHPHQLTQQRPLQLLTTQFVHQADAAAGHVLQQRGDRQGFEI